MLRYIGNPKYDPTKSNPSLNIANNTQKEVDCVIYDARNKMAAFGNKVAGKGYES